MIALWGIVFGLLIGFIRGGKLNNLGATRLRGLSIVFVALAVQLLIFPTPWWPEPPVSRATGALHLGSYALMVTFLILNRRYTPFWGVALGMAMNLTVIAVNGGYMPADLDALRATGQLGTVRKILASVDQTYGNVVAMSEATRLNFLGDWLVVPPWVPFAASFSLGDAVLMVSAAWLVQALMSDRERRNDDG